MQNYCENNCLVKNSSRGVFLFDFSFVNHSGHYAEMSFLEDRCGNRKKY